MTFSELAWKKSYPVYQKFIELPFNQGLMDGTLPLNIFAYALEQDSIYIPAELRSENAIASKIKEEYIPDFLRYSAGSLIYEQEVALFFKNTPNVTKTGNVTQATINYVDHLQATTILNVEIAVVAILPCFWFYEEAGKYFAEHPIENNPYQKWIDSYSSEGFKESTDNLIYIANELYNKATPEIREEMINSFYQSAIHEWHFTDDSYAMRSYDDFLG